MIKTKIDTNKAVRPDLIETEISYTNDVFFKFALIGDDTASCWLRKFIVRSVFGLSAKEMTIMNSEIIPKAIIGKKVILDVLCKDEDEHYIDFEMQVSGYSETEQLRFQEYGYHLVGRQLKKGDDYVYLKPFFQIIFMKAMPPHGHQLIQHFKVKDDNNLEEPNGTLNRAIIFLKSINLVVKKKGGFEHLSEFEKLCYILENNNDDVILKSESKAVRFIMEKQEEMRNNQSWWSWADAVERGEAAAKNIMRENVKKGEERGERRGEKRGERRGRQLEKQNILNELLIQKYGTENLSWLQTLNKLQLRQILRESFNCDTFQQLKQKIENMRF